MKVLLPFLDSLCQVISKEKSKNYSFKSYLWNTMNEGHNDADKTLLGKKDFIYNFFHVPFKLEGLFLFGLLICLDSFLFIFAFLPIRSIKVVLLEIKTIFKNQKIKNSPSQNYDLSRISILLVCFFLLNMIDSSYIYHFIRGQAALKLYVIFNLLEIFDKLFCSFGQDIFESLFNSILFRRTEPNSFVSYYIKPSISYLVALIYTFLHSFLLFFKVMTLNVSINAYNNSLLTLLISNNFVELKGIVFKSFKQENVFQIASSDIVERFQILVFLFIVFSNNLNDLSWKITQSTVEDIIYTFTLVIVMEILVDWLKHAFITRFNKMQSKIYDKFLIVIASTVLNQNNVPDPCFSTSKRIGFVPLPLSIVVIRVFFNVAPISGFLAIYWILMLWFCLIAIKFLISFIILFFSVRILENNNNSTLKIDGLSTTNAYDKIE